MKKFLIALLVLVLAAGAGTSVFLYNRQKQEEEQKNLFYQMRQSAAFSQTAQDVTQIPVDFEKLQQVNPDVYAWLTIPGTSMDVPVLQREGEVSYYLSHSWTGEEDPNGSVCSESQYNGKGFQDVHTVLYGNNCSDGSLFGGLSSFADETFFQEHRLMAVYTPEAVRYYRIFAAYEYDNRHLLQSFDCSNPEVLKRYVKEILQQRNLYSQVDETVTVKEGDRILTLSTTSSREKGRTFLVQGVLEHTFME